MLLMLVAALLLLAPAQLEAPCPAAPAAELLSLSYAAFDTAESNRAWRNLLNRGCVDAAVATLAAYRSANAGRMTNEQITELSFHIGQALAFSGRDGEAVAHFEAAVRTDSSPEWSAYVDATVGFLRKDRRRTEAAAERYAKIVGSESMRLAIIRGFLRCFDQSYSKAAHCGM